MTPDCVLCRVIQTEELLLDNLGGGLFVAVLDQYPITPGHTLVIPKRHAQYMGDLTEAEQRSVVEAALEVKKRLSKTDLTAKYQLLLKRLAGTKSEAYINHALAELERFDHRPPDAFNDGLNDGPAAGQTVPHFHWHVMPRWTGDVPEPAGGIRHFLNDLGNYHHHVKDQS